MHHTHIFASAHVRYPLETIERANAFIVQAIEACGMKVIAGPLSVIGQIPGNEGISTVAILDFSSASIHEWINDKLVHLDIYTCNGKPRWSTIASLFADLEPSSLRISIMDREELLG